MNAIDWIRPLASSCPDAILDPIARFGDDLINTQQDWAQALETFEPSARFRLEHFEHGTCHNWVCVIEEGEIFEKGGINVSWVKGEQLPGAASTRYPHLENAPFFALGISSVIHPRNPYLPTTHANVRVLMAIPEEGPITWWTGGGFDLTPYYGFEEDCVHWHRSAKNACDPFGSDLYPRFKTWCDSYFYLKHRQEARGIGGVFYDDFNELPIDVTLDFSRSIASTFIRKAYVPIVEKRHNTPYGERERSFQSWRRGRYAEFNLVYDRGTLFGLQFGGRPESILMSLPPQVSWRYNHHPEAQSPEAALARDFLPAKDWLKGHD